MDCCRPSLSQSGGARWIVGKWKGDDWLPESEGPKRAPVVLDRCKEEVDCLSSVGGVRSAGTIDELKSSWVIVITADRNIWNVDGVGKLK